MNTRKKQVLITLIGTDGSGKTSTLNALSSMLETSQYTSSQLWCGAESYLMRPIRAVLSLARRNAAVPGKGNTTYESEVFEKQELGRKFGIFTRLYVWLVLLDYGMQYQWRMWRYRNSQVLLLDRYFFDVAVNLALTLGWSTSQLIGFIQVHSGRFRLPDLRCFVYVPPTISMARKDDIPDISYLELRLKYYQSISNHYTFYVVDGQGSVNDNAADLYRKLQQVMQTCQVHYVHSNNEDVGGADYCSFRMAQAVNDSETYSSVVSLRLRTDIVQQYQDAGVPVHLGSFCRPQLSRGLFPILSLPFRGVHTIWYFWRLFRRQQPDIVHLNDLYDFLPGIAARIAGIPVVYHIRMIRTNALEIAILSLLVRYLSAMSFSVSEAVRETYFSQSSVARPVHLPLVVHDWADPTLIDLTETSERPDEFAPYEIVVVMIGRIEWWKGQHVFLEAVRGIKERYTSVGFFLIGGTVSGKGKQAYAEKMLAIAEELGVHYLGIRKDISAILAHTDISVHASVTPDPFPGVVLESLLSKSATIGAAAGGVNEMIRNEIDGLTYTPGDVSALTTCLEKLLDHQPTRLRYALSGRRHILEVVDKETILGDILAHYSTCWK